MKREIHALIQGSQPWHAFRACHDGASEAAAMLGLSKHTTRSELLAQKSTGIAKEFSSFVQDRIFARGHELEARARPIAEEIIGEEIYPATYSFGRMSASLDGLTIDGVTAWEHKQFSESLFLSVKRGELPDDHMPQCQQIMCVTGAERLLFTCSDGTLDKCAHMWVHPTVGWPAILTHGWEQFNIELAAYVHVEAAPVAVATPTMALPALSIQVNGSLTLVDNLPVFGARLHAFIDGIDKSPSDDQAFADAEAAIKVLEKAEDALERERERALGQTASISEMVNTVALYADLARTTRLVLTKMVKARKETIKIEIIDKGKKALAEHVAALNSQIVNAYMPAVPADFAGAVKGLRTVSSMLDAVGVELARAIISANAIAGNIHLNLSAIRDLGGECPFLFVDESSIVLKDPEHVVALINLRISTHKEAEVKRIQAEREKIRVEEAAKIKVAQEWAADELEKNKVLEMERVRAEIVRERELKASADLVELRQLDARIDTILEAGRVEGEQAKTGTEQIVDMTLNTGAIDRPSSAQLVESVAIYWGVGESIAVEWLMRWKPVRNSTAEQERNQ